MSQWHVLKQKKILLSCALDFLNFLLKELCAYLTIILWHMLSHCTSKIWYFCQFLMKIRRHNDTMSQWHTVKNMLLLMTPPKLLPETCWPSRKFTGGKVYEMSPNVLQVGSIIDTNHVTMTRFIHIQKETAQTPQF